MDTGSPSCHSISSDPSLCCVVAVGELAMEHLPFLQLQVILISHPVEGEHQMLFMSNEEATTSNAVDVKQVEVPARPTMSIRGRQILTHDLGRRKQRPNHRWTPRSHGPLNAWIIVPYPHPSRLMYVVVEVEYM